MAIEQKRLVKRLILSIVFILLLLFIGHVAVAATRTYIVQETDFVKIQVAAVDPDKDPITYNFSAPLDERGEWQTDYDDAGEYEVDITASDGVNEAMEKVKLIVENKNQPPMITQKKLVVKETQPVDLKLNVEDPDDDPLEYKFQPPFDANGMWQTGYDDEGNLLAKFTVSDGEFEVEGRVEITVIQTNQPPVINGTFSEAKQVQHEEGETFDFFVEASDGDEQPLTYQWLLDEQEISQDADGEYYFDFASAGEHILKLTVSDGMASEYKEWNLKVENTNREPEIKHIPVTVEEGEKVVLEFPQEDPDGDELTYTFSAPLNEQGEWQTDYQDAGEYILNVTAFDGEFEDVTKVKIDVLDVDRAPVLILPEKLEVWESEQLVWEIETYDEDGDNITIEIKGAVEGAELNERRRVFYWTPTFDTIKRRGGLVSDALNALRLEHFFLRKKHIPLEIEVCGKQLCSFGEVKIIVHNVNRQPMLEEIGSVFVEETEEISLEAKAVDPDGDIVHYSFSKPLGKKTGSWQTDYDDAGEYTVEVTATDGHDSYTAFVEINVLPKNRHPNLIIKDDDVVVNEGQPFTIHVKAADPDNDKVTIRLEHLPPGASFVDGAFRWEAPFASVKNKSANLWNDFVSSTSYLNKKLNNEKTVQWLQFVASDAEYEVIHPVKVTIKNVNQRPEIIDFLPVTNQVVHVNEPVVFHVLAKDADGDKLEYAWSFSFHEEKIKGTDTIERTFVSPGIKKVSVTVSDGRDAVKKEWVVSVLEEEFLEKFSGELTFTEPFTTRLYVVEG